LHGCCSCRYRLLLARFGFYEVRIYTVCQPPVTPRCSLGPSPDYLRIPLREVLGLTIFSLVFPLRTTSCYSQYCRGILVSGTKSRTDRVPLVFSPLPLIIGIELSPAGLPPYAILLPGHFFFFNTSPAPLKFALNCLRREFCDALYTLAAPFIYSDLQCFRTLRQSRFSLFLRRFQGVLFFFYQSTAVF